MQGAYGGLIVILMYAGLETAIVDQFALITDNSIFILTDLSQDILTQ